jgi:hypothetical protein
MQKTAGTVTMAHNHKMGFKALRTRSLPPDSISFDDIKVWSVISL